MTTLITLAGEKGGIGKTTLSYHIMCYLAEQGSNVLGIDLDPQGSLSYCVTGEHGHRGVRRLVMKDWPLSAATIEVQGYEGRLHVLPGHKSTGDVRIYLSSSGSHLNALDWLTGAAREAGYEYVIVDTPPAPAIDNETRQVLDALIAPAFFAAHFVLAPVQLEQLAIAGLASLSATLDILRQMGGTARLLGVVPMMYDARTTEHAIHLQDLVSVYNNLVYPVVGKAIDVARCPVYGLPVWEFAPKSKASAQLRAVAERMARDVKDQG